MSDELIQIAVGMILAPKGFTPSGFSDAYICRKNKEAFIKFQQGSKQQAFIEHLFCKFGLYCFMEKPSHLFTNQNKFSSYWFRTFSHPSFTKLFLLFYTNSTDTKQISLVNPEGVNRFKRKTITPNLIRDHVTPRSLAYWIMCDGSLTKTKKALILHTQGFTEKESIILSKELNEKFKLNSKVISHKHKETDTRKEKNEFTILIPTEDRAQLASLITQYMIPSMTYKIPIPLP